MRILNKPAYAAGVLLDDEYFPGSVGARHTRAGEAHVGELNDLARGIAETEAEKVPLFDPDSGGRNAEVLVLLHEPLCGAARGARMVSRHSNDRTAGNMYVACEDAGLGYEDAVHWNVIPWWVQNPDKMPASSRRSVAEQARRAAPHLAALLSLLGELKSVVLVGGDAQRAWDRAVQTAELSVPEGVQVLRAPHTSPLAWHQRGADGRLNRDITVSVLREAAGHR